MDRVLVLGGCGAGKSTLARKLGELHGLKVVHLDSLFWKPGWVESTPEEFRAAVRREVLPTERWVTDGNWVSGFDLRLPYADTIVLLDLSPWLCVARVIARTVRKRRVDVLPGCDESVWRPEFLEFLRYVWRCRRDKLPEVRAAIASSSAELIVLTTPRQVAAFLARQAR